MRRFLIVSGGLEALEIIARARAMGLYVLVSDRDPDAPGFALADEALIASTYHPDETLRAVRAWAATGKTLDGVMAAAADVPHTVAAVANAFGLPGPSPEAARLATDKLAMKHCLAAAGVPVPWFTALRDVQDLRAALTERGSTLVVKPVDSRGGRGVQLMDTGTDPDLAFARARAESASGRVMAEAYLDGPQVSTESLVQGGECLTVGYSDRNYEFLERFAPFFVENGGDLPSHLPQTVLDDIDATVGRAAEAMGLSHGTVKGDIVIHRGRAHVIELAARLSGGWFCSREIPLSTGVDFVGAAIRLALGETIDLEAHRPRLARPIVQRYVFPPPGRVAGIEGLDAARALPGVLDAVPILTQGRIVPQAESCSARAAMVLATGADMAAARAAAEAAVAAIRVRTIEAA